MHGFAGFVMLHALIVAGWSPAYAAAATLVAALACAWLLHRIVETPSHGLAQRVSRSLSRADRARRQPPLNPDKA